MSRTSLNVLFLVLFIAVSFCLNYDELLNKRPQGPHTWRQTDCTSIALNYHQYDASFLEPQMHNQVNKLGVALGEFPLLYFVVGKLYNIFGFHEILYRSFWLLIALAGSFSLYRLALELTGTVFESLLIGLMLLLSPVVSFYSISFIPDTPALYIACISLYLFHRALRKKSGVLFISGILALSFAGLLKVSALIIPFSLLGTYALYLITKKEWKLFKYIFLGIASVTAINFIWYSYASWYNKAHYTTYFFIQIRPIWESTKMEIIELTKIIFRDRLKEFYNADIISFSIALFLISILKLRQFLWHFAFILVTFIGSSIFILLFYPQFEFHDYYMINLVIIVPLIYLICLKIIRHFNLKGRLILILQVALLLIMIKSTLVANEMLQFRFNNSTYSLFQNTDYFYLEEELNELGISKSDMVISIPDPSSNTTLYLMNRKGWTNLYYDQMTAEEIERIKSWGGKYLIIGSEELLRSEELKPYTVNKVGSYHDIEIFKL